MYLTQFGLTRHPFERALEPDELFASSAVCEAQVRLTHLVELRGIGLITGEVGSGKTTACRRLAATLHPGLHRLFYVPLSTGNVMDMYKAIAWQLGLAGGAQPRRRLPRHPHRGLPPGRRVPHPPRAGRRRSPAPALAMCSKTCGC